jgi:hypothetical protein
VGRSGTKTNRPNAEVRRHCDELPGWGIAGLEQGPERSARLAARGIGHTKQSLDDREIGAAFHVLAKAGRREDAVRN